MEVNEVGDVVGSFIPWGGALHRGFQPVAERFLECLEPFGCQLPCSSCTTLGPHPGEGGPVRSFTCRDRGRESGLPAIFAGVGPPRQVFVQPGAQLGVQATFAGSPALALQPGVQRGLSGVREASVATGELSRGARRRGINVPALGGRQV